MAQLTCLCSDTTAVSSFTLSDLSQVCALARACLDQLITMSENLQVEVDKIRSELAALRQSIGKNKTAGNVAKCTHADAVPGGNMV